MSRDNRAAVVLRRARKAQARRRAACPVPPHADHKTLVTRTPAARGAGAAGRTARWVAAAPADRATLPAAAAALGAGAVLHAAHADPALILALGAGGAGLAYGRVLHRGKDAGRARKAAAAAGTGGAWLAGSVQWGALAGPGHFMGWAWLAAAGVGYGMLRTDEHVTARRQHRAAKAAWHELAARLGLAGSHLLHREDTRLGEAMTIDVTGTGRRASQLAGDALAERIAEHYRLPPGRVRVSAERIAGRIRISIRHRDPWAAPVLHPLLDPAPEHPLGPVATIRRPLPIGADPETGRPLELEVWDEDGARRLLIIAQTGGGKSVLLNCVTERLTAADDVVIWSINLSKAKEDRRWAGACDLSAIGPGDRKRALAMLRLARKVIDYRGADLDGEAVFQPGPGHPVIMLKIDEIDTLAAASDPMGQAIREELVYVGSKGRSEGVGILAAGQRGVVSFTGTADFRSQFDQVALLKTTRKTEAMHAAGDLGLTLPDVGSYGEGHPGVVVLADLSSGAHQVGRTFLLKDLGDISRLAAGRAPAELEPGLVEHLGEAYARLKDAPAGGPARAPAPAAAAAAPVLPATPPDNPLRMLARAVLSGAVQAPAEMREAFAAAEQAELDREARQAADMDALDAELEDALPADLRQVITARNAATRAMLAQTAAMVMPEVPADKASFAAAAAAERRRQAAAAVNIPGPARARLLELLGTPGGVSRGEVADALGVGRMTAWRYLDRLRFDGLAADSGKGRGARWHRPAGDGQ